MARQQVRARSHDNGRSLGWLAVAWMEFFVRHGPGDVQGEPIEHGDEYTGFIVDCYAVDEKGRRLYDSAFLSRPKGCDKSGLASRLSLFEALGPCRILRDELGEPVFAQGGEVYTDPWGLGFEHVYEPGEPMGAPVKVPYIRCMATEEGQTGAVYDAIYFNLTDEDCPLSEVLDRADDAGLTRVLLPGGGEITPSTSGAASKDGGKETFAIFDEALDLETPLPTPSGWTSMADVKVGDELIGSDGSPVRIVKVTDVQHGRKCYRVTFRDGASVVASDGHLWQTKLVGSGAKSRIRTTGEIVADGRRMAVPPSPVSEGRPADLDIDPYVLGAWLGDGDCRNATITACPDDMPAMVKAVESRGYTTRALGNQRRAAGIYISLPGSRRNRFSPVDGLKVRLERAGLLQNKHIPPHYLAASVEQRTELLRGLMDTDGSVGTNGCCTFANSNKRLLADVNALLVSLGQRVGEGWQDDSRSRLGRTGRLWFTPRWGLQPFAMSRKAERVRETDPWTWNTITSIEAVESVPVRCVAVDAADHLFLAGEGRTVTHNTHLYNRPELHRMYSTVVRNLRKRKKIAETWFLETTTMYAPGEESVAEQTYKVAQLIQEGQTKREKLLLDHRFGEINVEDLGDEKKLRQALTDAYGEALAWNDIDGMVDGILDPRSDIADSIRYFFNDHATAENAWLAGYEWAARADATKVVADKEAITLGFDGSRSRQRGTTDATALIGCRVSDGHIFEIDVWEQPHGAGARAWEVPVEEVLATVSSTFEKYDVVGMYADPARWDSHVAVWEREHGPRLRVKSSREHPIEWWMTGNRRRHTAEALEKLRGAVIDGDMTHDGSSTLTRHVLAARRAKAGQITKDSPDSDRKIDAAVAATLAWQCRLDAIAKGVGRARRTYKAKRLR